MFRETNHRCNLFECGQPFAYWGEIWDFQFNPITLLIAGSSAVLEPGVELGVIRSQNGCVLSVFVSGRAWSEKRLYGWRDGSLVDEPLNIGALEFVQYTSQQIQKSITAKKSAYGY